MKLLLDIIMSDIFGRIAEEKEVVAITGKMKEAKGRSIYSFFSILSFFVFFCRSPNFKVESVAKKGFEAYKLVAQSMNFHQLYNILLPLKAVMETTEDSKVLHHVPSTSNK